jgi:thiamine kinase-like enzyme
MNLQNNTKIQNIELDLFKIELASVGFINSKFSLTPIRKGIANTAFKLKLDSESSPFFVKFFSSAGADRQDRKAQYRLQCNLAKKGLAPNAIYLAKNTSFQIDEWLGDRFLESKNITDVEVIDILSYGLSSVHACGILHNELPLINDWKHYLDIAPTDDEKLIERFEVCETIWCNSPKKILCHHDLALSHIRLKPNLKIVDWEYAALSNSAYDIASTVLANDFDNDSATKLIHAYAMLNGKNEKELLDEYIYMLQVATLTYDLWHRAFLQTSKID